MIENGIRVDGLEIRYLEEGQGPVILLVHGGTLGFSADVWRPNMAPLAAAGYRVIAYDQPGFGLSDNPPDFAPKYREQFMLKLLDALQISRAVLVGHSQAGGFVVSSALQAPQRFLGIVVLGTGSLLPPLGEKVPDVDATTHEPTIADTEALLKANLTKHELITPALLENYHRMCIARNFTNAVQRGQARSGKGGGDAKPLWQRLDEVRVPLLLIYGKNDRALAAERVVLARERYPTLPYHLLEDCHHMVQWDGADDFVRLTKEFVRTVPRF